MPRIRSIKPEFPQSESMGRVSRDARLTFIQLWTLADDDGRLRGNSRMLASLLFPYDDDARELIDSWLEELDREACIERYCVDGASYIQIRNWLTHQKIDHPSKSKIPPNSGTLAKPREDKRLDQGLDQGLDLKKHVELHSTPVEEANGKHATPPGDVSRVFEHWREVWGKRKAQLDPKRLRVIKIALKSYTVEDLCKAVAGYRNSPHHRGENERRTPYDDIELFLRDSKHIEAGLQFADKNPGGLVWQ